MVVPFTSASVRVLRPQWGKGMDVVLGAQSSLRRYFHQLATHAKVWSADDVIEAFTALELASFLP